MFTRRELGKAVLAAVPVAAGFARSSSKINGVVVGAQGYSFRDMSLDDSLRAMNTIGISYCEIFFGHIEPKGLNREQLRQWRLSVPMKHFHDVRQKFSDAGITITAYSLNIRKDFSDAEVERAMEMTRALGVDILTSSSSPSDVRRIDRYAAKANVIVGMHNHGQILPDEFATPANFRQALTGTTHIAINLDSGHFVAAGFDPVRFLAHHHDKIVSLHIKDRKSKKNGGAIVPFGTGDTPIRELLQMLKKNRWPIPALIEYEYEGKDTITEVRRCYDYCREALA
jgi:sugar phosphate isomerase/epimerase